jgi:WD40 repeat protein
MKFRLIDDRVNKFCLGVCMLGLATGISKITTAQTVEPSREPILRIETRMHTGIIKGVGVDRAGKFLVTASTDKTVRVWELATSRLLRVKELTGGKQTPTTAKPNTAQDFSIAVKR